MSIAINPNLPVVAVPGATADVVLQPGTVVKAQVLQVLGHGEARISIGGQALAVTTQVPLQAGETLQLSVSQADDGTVQLAVVNPQGDAAAGAAASADLVTLASEVLADLAAQATLAAVTPQNQLSVPEQLAVSSAAQIAATQQTGLAPLFANLGVASGIAGLPLQVQQAVALVLGQRTSLTPGLTGEDIQQAFQGSGLFLEAALAADPASASATPDLKAALVVLRQVLTASLGGAAATADLASATIVPQAAATQAAVPDGQGAPIAVPTSPQPVIAADASHDPQASATASPAPTPASTPASPLAPEIVVVEAPPQGGTASLPQAVLEFGAPAAASASAVVPADATARAAASGAALTLLQETVQASPLLAANPLAFAAGDGAMLSLLPVLAGARIANADEAETARSTVPPPPLRGALPAAQPVLPPTLVKNASPETVMRQLLSDSDGAVARQTLLQVASLPDQGDSGASRPDPTASRWNFEIPFATAQGATAMAQFEISCHGGGHETDAAPRVWRARFSLDVEPAGPVHALISLSGERTSVRMWAERPATAEQLRAGVSQLSQALLRAELQPGEIVIRDGAPVPPAAARAGHFLDRAS